MVRGLHFFFHKQLLTGSHYMISAFVNLYRFLQVLVIFSHDRHFSQVSIGSIKYWLS